MGFKTTSNKAATFTFTYDFSDIDTAQVANHALFGYFIGTYYSPIFESTIKDQGTVSLIYKEDRNINKALKRICDSFKNYNKK